jgi:tetratricopeptide (TPR) repeat protein
MPSLSELEKFKASFQHLGGQKADLISKNIPYDDLPLPENEPEPLPTPEEAAEPDIDMGVFTEEDFADTGPETEPETESETEPEDDMDFSAFLDSQPNELPEPPAADIPEDELYAPEGLLSNLSEELDAIPPDFPDEPPPADIEEKTLDLDSLDNFDLPEEPLSAADSENLEPIILGDMTTPDGLDASADEPEETEIDLPEEPASEAELDLPEEAAADGADENLDLDNLGDLSLPEETSPTDGSEESFDLDNLGDLDIPEEATPTDGSEESFDLDNLGDLNLPEGTSPTSDSEESFDLDNLGDLNLPEEAASTDGSEESFDLDSLGDLDIPEETSPPKGDEESFDLDNLGDLDLPEEASPANDSEESLDLDNLGDLDIPEETAADGEENLDLDSLGDLTTPEDLDISDESPDMGNLDDLNLPEDSSSADGGEESLDLGNLDDFNLPEDTSSTDGGEESLDLGNLDDFNLPEDSSSADGGEDSLDLGNLDESVADGEKPPEETSTDDFSIPDLDNMLKKSAKAPKPSEPPKRRKKLRGKERRQKIESAIHDNIDEIQLSNDEFEGLQETLSRYPLNLRIACEEIIAEQVIDAKQLSELIEHLVWGASAKETAVLAGRILGRTITIPKAFEKSTGAALEAEQASFAYIFVHSFLPILRLVVFIGVVLLSLLYLLFTFVYIPNEAEKLYKRGYERIFAGEYQRANEHFNDAFFNYSRKKNWFYKYAEAFRDERQYLYAEQKYDDLLRYYPRDKKGVLDYANLETYYLYNYEKADEKLRHQLLDYNPNDIDGLLAAGDNYLLWGEIDPSQYEKARFNYARVLELKGWQAPVVERMMKYFIRTDNLREVLPLKNWFDDDPKKRVLSPESLGELGGYLLDKQLEDVKGVPNEFVEYIGSVREMLLKAIYEDPSLPEPHYHLARYYHNLGNAREELITLRVANKAFDEAPEGSIRRINYRIDALQRYADSLINAREFFTAEEQLIKGINLYEDAVSRRLISRTPQYGRLFAGLGDLEYFTKVGDMEAALRYYHRSEQNGWTTPDMQYRMGSAYYQLENWKGALEYFFNASTSLPQNRRILYALGNSALKRGDYFAANGYYNRLLDILETQRIRMPVLLPNDRPEYLELAERLMNARNNAGVANEMLAAQTGNRAYHSRALAYYAESSHAWDALTRDPKSMIRSGSIPLPYMNSQYALRPQTNYEPQIFIRIDREAREDSIWEELAPVLRQEHHLPN